MAEPIVTAPRTGATLALALSLAFLTSCEGPALMAKYNRLRGDPYPLDSLDRALDPEVGPKCPEIALERVTGEDVSFVPAVRVVPPFAERLRRFERVLAEVSTRYYGREPSRIVNAGAYYCRAVRHRSERLSEHALGNAIDVIGFDFPPLPTPKDAVEKLPEPLESNLSVRVQAHWQAQEGVEAYHARFLEALGHALADQDVFRTLLGPSHPTHGTHFHFDMAPYEYVRL